MDHGLFADFVCLLIFFQPDEIFSPSIFSGGCHKEIILNYWLLTSDRNEMVRHFFMISNLDLDSDTRKLGKFFFKFLDQNFWTTVVNWTKFTHNNGLTSLTASAYIQMTKLFIIDGPTIIFVKLIFFITLGLRQITTNTMFISIYINWLSDQYTFCWLIQGLTGPPNPRAPNQYDSKHQVDQRRITKLPFHCYSVKFFIKY